MTAPDERRADVDWLRIGAVYLLIPFHAAKVFDDMPFYHLKDPAQSGGLSLVTGAVHQWHMPLLFALAGWSLGHSLQRRTRAAVMHERGARLLVPLGFACVSFLPVIGYVQYRHLDAGQERFLTFVPTFFTNLDRFTWSHLWFLAYLYAFTVLYLPLLARAGSARRIPGRVPPAAVYAALPVLALVQVTLRGRWPGHQNLYDDWANFAYYSLFFIGGFVLLRFPPVEQAVHRERRRMAALAVAGLAGLGAIVALPGEVQAGVNPSWIAFQACSAAAGLGGVCSLLGFGARYLRREGPAFAYLRDSAMPVYVLHQVVVVGLAALVIQLGAPLPAKLALLTAAATAGTIGAYHLGVRRYRLARLLTGTKGAPPRPRARTLYAAARSSEGWAK